ncbi:MAG TPA: hypothetical protein VGN57_14330 [Pirellulaceae bacterium]|jgi:hypothetical protein|nr:hypothetical protein [Pirellulaceae bacterium]
MLRRSIFASVGSTGISLSLAAVALGQANPPAVAPPPPAAPPAVATPSVQPDLTPRVVPGAPAPVVVAQVQNDPAAVRTEIRAELTELVRLAQEVEALNEATPVPPNAEDLRQRALEQIRTSWKEATDRVVRLPENDRAAYEQAIGVWDNDVITSTDLQASLDAIPRATEDPAPAATAVVVPTEVPLKTKTIEAVSAELTRPNDAAFPAEWDGTFDETVDRYVFDDVVEMRDAQGLIQIVPFRAEWAFSDGAWQLAFLRVNGQVTLERQLQSAIPVGQRPALVYVDRQPETGRVAVGARKAVSDLRGAYLGYRNFMETSRTWTLADGTTFQAKLIEAGSRGRGVVATFQTFNQPARPLPIVRLSPADQAYIVSWMNQNPEAVPPTIPLP